MAFTESRCLGCSSLLPDPFLDLGSMPLANAYVPAAEASRPQPSYPLAVAYCPGCHLVQLIRRVPPEEMFTEYLYLSSYSESFLSHAQKMANSLIERFGLGPKHRVLEVGSNDGYLLQFFQRRAIPVLGVEPAKNIAGEAERRGIPTLNRFFEPDAVQEILGSFGAADLIIGNNVLAHVPGINGFLAAVRSCLAPTGVAIFEFPHVKELLEKIEFDTIYHEHVFYYSLSAVRILAERAGLELFDVLRQKVHGGSLRIFLQAKSGNPVSPAVEALLKQERDAGLTDPERFAVFSRQVVGLKEKLLALMRSLKEEGRRLAAYGAPAKGNALLNYCGIGTELLEFTVDRNLKKQGMLTPGARLLIRPPEDLLSEMPDYTLILPWNIADEILQQQAAYRRRGGRFIIPIPEPRVV